MYLEMAEMVLSSEDSAQSTVATGNAVLAAIAAADALCCALAGERYRGSAHRRAADFLEKVTGDKALGTALRDAIYLKDQGHYGLANVQVSTAKKAIRRAASLVASAERSVA